MARKRYYRSKRKKQFAFDSSLIVGLAIAGLLLSIFPNLLESNSFELTFYVWIIFPIALLFLFLALIFIVLNNYRSWQYLRSLDLSNIDEMTGIQFENYVANLFKDKGYQVKRTPVSGDFGADLIATKGEDTYAVQLKRYSSAVGIKAVQEAVAAKAHYKANKCAVITNFWFTNAAINLAKSNDCILVDRKTLGKWIWQFGKNQ